MAVLTSVVPASIVPAVLVVTSAASVVTAAASVVTAAASVVTALIIVVVVIAVLFPSWCLLGIALVLFVLALLGLVDVGLLVALALLNALTRGQAGSERANRRSGVPDTTHGCENRNDANR